MKINKYRENENIDNNLNSVNNRIFIIIIIIIIIIAFLMCYRFKLPSIVWIKKWKTKNKTKSSSPKKKSDQHHKADHHKDDSYKTDQHKADQYKADVHKFESQKLDKQDQKQLSDVDKNDSDNSLKLVTKLSQKSENLLKLTKLFADSGIQVENLEFSKLIVDSDFQVDNSQLSCSSHPNSTLKVDASKLANLNAFGLNEQSNLKNDLYHLLKQLSNSSVSNQSFVSLIKNLKQQSTLSDLTSFKSNANLSKVNKK